MEKLVLLSNHEVWTRRRDGAVQAQILLSFINGEAGKVLPIDAPNDPIKDHIRQADAVRDRPAKTDPRVWDRLKKDYQACRREFIGGYRTLVKEAGYTLEDLDLAFLQGE